MIVKCIKGLADPAAPEKTPFVFGEYYFTETIGEVEKVKVFLDLANEDGMDMDITDTLYPTYFASVPATTTLTEVYEVYEVTDSTASITVSSSTLNVTPEQSVRIGKFKTLTEALTLADIKAVETKKQYTISKPMYKLGVSAVVDVKVTKL